MPLKVQENFWRKEDARKTIDLDILPHQLFELFFDGEVIQNLRNQSKLYSLNKNNFTFKISILMK